MLIFFFGGGFCVVPMSGSKCTYSHNLSEPFFPLLLNEVLPTCANIIRYAFIIISFKSCLLFGRYLPRILLFSPIWHTKKVASRLILIKPVSLQKKIDRIINRCLSETLRKLTWVLSNPPYSYILNICTVATTITHSRVSDFKLICCYCVVSM